MLFSKEVQGTYGSGKTPATIFVINDTYANYYCVEGSVNVNVTYDEIEEGTDIETLSDFDTMTASKPIETIEQLEALLNEEEDTEANREFYDTLTPDVLSRVLTFPGTFTDELGNAMVMADYLRQNFLREENPISKECAEAVVNLEVNEMCGDGQCDVKRIK